MLPLHYKPESNQSSPCSGLCDHYTTSASSEGRNRTCDSQFQRLESEPNTDPLRRRSRDSNPDLLALAGIIKPLREVYAAITTERQIEFPSLDSDQNYNFQRVACYHYTTGESFLSELSRGLRVTNARFFQLN